MSVRNARKVVNQVKKLQDMMAGTTNPSAQQWSPVLSDVGELVTEAAAFLQPLSPKIKVRARVAPDLPKSYLDPDQIQQMLVNLYDNSAEAFADTAGGEGTIDINVISQPDESCIIIIYADDGPGIPDDIAADIFDEGFTTKEEAEGTGLFECFIVANNHDGEIVCKPDQHKGVLFSIRIPIIKELKGNRR